MSQHDMVVDNASGATVRADINNALQALASTSKGNSAPSTPYSGQFWLDDNTPSSSVWTLFMYDGTDWVALGTFDTTNNIWDLYGGRRLLSSQSASASASIDFTSVISSLYSEYELTIDSLIPATGAADLWLRGSTNNGSSYLSGTEAQHVRSANTTAAAGTFTGAGATSDSKIVLAGSLATTAARGCSGVIRFNRTTNNFNWQLHYLGNSGDYVNLTGGGMLIASSINALRLLMSSGNITSGTVKLWGLR